MDGTPVNLSAVRGQKNTFASFALTSRAGENVVRTWLKVFDKVPDISASVVHVRPWSPNCFEKVLIRPLFNVEKRNFYRSQSVLDHKDS